MQKNEFVHVMAFLAAGCGVKELTEVQTEVYWQLLGQFEKDVLLVAIKQVIVEHQFANLPPVGTIYKKVMELTSTTSIPTAGESWEEAWGAMLKHGYDFQADALASLSPVTLRCVKNIGWGPMCYEKNISTLRAHYFRVYEEFSRKAEQEKNMLPEFQAKRVALKSGEEKVIGQLTVGLLKGISDA